MTAFRLGNPFDCGDLPHPGDIIARTDLVLSIKSAIRERGLTVADAAHATGASAAAVTALLRGEIEGWPEERLDRLRAVLLTVPRRRSWSRR